MSLATSTKSGFSLIELVIAVGVFVIFVAGVSYLAFGDYTPFVGGGDTKQEERYAQEMIEAIRIIKERSWKELSVYAVCDDTFCGLLEDYGLLGVKKDASGTWVLDANGVGNTLGSFTRYLSIHKVARDSSGNVDLTSGTLDPSTMRVVIVVYADFHKIYTFEEFIVNNESYKQSQTGWGGSSGVDEWTVGTGDYYSATTMDVPTSSGTLMIDPF